MCDSLAVVVNHRLGVLAGSEVFSLVGMKAEEDIVHPTVIMAFKLDEFRPPGNGTGQAQHGLYRLRSSVVEVHDLKRRHRFHQ